MTSKFNIAEFELQDTSTMTVQNATGTGDLIVDGKPVTIELYGPGSDVVRQLEHREAQESATRMRKMLQGKADPVEQEKWQVSKLVRRTKSISENFPLSPEDLYSNRKLVYIHRQVIKHLDDEANFSKASTTN